MTAKELVFLNLEHSRRGLSSYDLINSSGLKGSTVRARIADLVREGRVVDTGKTVLIPTGNRATVWDIANRPPRVPIPTVRGCHRSPSTTVSEPKRGILGFLRRLLS